jgi:hypothetical protein
MTNKRADNSNSNSNGNGNCRSDGQGNSNGQESVAGVVEGEDYCGG